MSDLDLGGRTNSARSLHATIRTFATACDSVDSCRTLYCSHSTSHPIGELDDGSSFARGCCCCGYSAGLYCSSSGWEWCSWICSESKPRRRH